MHVELFSVLVDTRRLSVGVFKQFEVASLCAHDGRRDMSLELIGTVRYKVGYCDYWVLAKRGDSIVRCTLNPHLTPDASFEADIERYRRLSTATNGSASPTDFWSERLAQSLGSQGREKFRHQAHMDAASMAQLFIGLK